MHTFTVITTPILLESSKAKTLCAVMRWRCRFAAFSDVPLCVLVGKWFREAANVVHLFPQVILRVLRMLLMLCI